MPSSKQPLWFSKTTIKLFRAAVNKVIIARIIANIPNE
jgi:hypothetical protein